MEQDNESTLAEKKSVRQNSIISPSNFRIIFFYVNLQNELLRIG